MTISNIRNIRFSACVQILQQALRAVRRYDSVNDNPRRRVGVRTADALLVLPNSGSKIRARTFQVLFIF